jgi:hypothetical protein
MSDDYGDAGCPTSDAAMTSDAADCAFTRSNGSSKGAARRLGKAQVEHNSGRAVHTIGQVAGHRWSDIRRMQFTARECRAAHKTYMYSAGTSAEL